VGGANIRQASGAEIQSNQKPEVKQALFPVGG
jgi:hypothetical protein